MHKLLLFESVQHFVYFSSFRSIEKKIDVLKDWFEVDPKFDDYAGCLLLGYEAFMKIVNYSASKNCTRLPSEALLIEKRVSKYLLKPGVTIRCIHMHSFLIELNHLLQIRI